VLFGQIAGGLAQPFFTNSPAKLAGEWFPVSERNLATTVASMCNPLGIALGQILPTLLVDAKAQDFAPLLMWQLVGIAVLTGITLLLFQPQPEFAPSIATRERRLTRVDQQQRRQRYL
jgi:FLVCR family feline leukemia virus subgroup C receptor-related protein